MQVCPSSIPEQEIEGVREILTIAHLIMGPTVDQVLVPSMEASPDDPSQRKIYAEVSVYLLPF